MLWFITIILGILSIILLSGRGSFLIAGYNTATKKQKAAYDEKKLCRVTGGGLGIMTLMLLLCALFGEQAPHIWYMILGIGSAATILLLIILLNTICKVKNAAEIEDIEETEDEKQKSKKFERGVWIFFAVIVVFVGIFLTTGNINFQAGEESLSIKASYWADKSIAYADIRSAEYSETLRVGRRDNGFGSFKLEMGRFKNTEFGRYTLYSYIKCKSYVILDTTEGIVVLNAENAGDTKQLYEDIMRKIPIS